MIKKGKNKKGKGESWNRGWYIGKWGARAATPKVNQCRIPAGSVELVTEETTFASGRAKRFEQN